MQELEEKLEGREEIIETQKQCAISTSDQIATLQMQLEEALSRSHPNNESP